MTKVTTVNDLGYVTSGWEYTGKLDRNGRKTTRRTWTCPFWKAWSGMLERCFYDSYRKRKPSYANATCCEDWRYASRFKKWMEKQDWEGKQLDKDIILPYNKVYSPDTCAFVHRKTNMFIVASDATRGEFPLGVSWHMGAERYIAYCRDSISSKKGYLGLFNTPEEAHEAWRERKHELAQLVAATETDPRVVEALKKRYSYEEWYKNIRTKQEMSATMLNVI